MVSDAYGDARHVAIEVVSNAFEGLSSVQRQRLVYKVKSCCPTGPLSQTTFCLVCNRKEAVLLRKEVSGWLLLRFSKRHLLICIKPSCLPCAPSSMTSTHGCLPK